MRLILKIGYYNILLSKETNIDSILRAFDNAKVVHELGYGENADYVIKKEEKHKISLEIIQDDRISTKEPNETETKG